MAATLLIRIAADTVTSDWNVRTCLEQMVQSGWAEWLEPRGISVNAQMITEVPDLSIDSTLQRPIPKAAVIVQVSAPLNAADITTFAYQFMGASFITNEVVFQEVDALSGIDGLTPLERVVQSFGLQHGSQSLMQAQISGEYYILWEKPSGLQLACHRPATTSAWQMVMNFTQAILTGFSSQWG